MFNLHIIEARYGDCFVLEYGTNASPRYLLIDGGPGEVYEPHLKPLLETIRGRGGALDAAIVSHVDDDHIHGLLDLLTDLQWQRVREKPEVIAIGELWHNTFSETVGDDVQRRFSQFLDRAGPMRALLGQSDLISRDIAQGDALTRAARTLGVPVNSRFGQPSTITVCRLPYPVILENLALHIVGPTQASLEALRDEWLAWLAAREEQAPVEAVEGAARAMRRADTSVPNLSSIMFLAQADGRSILFTGDGRSDHILQGLAQAGLLDADGKCHVDVLKLPHHGSKYNASSELFQRVTADCYLISASGKHGHPHKDTLKWIVEAARDQGRQIEILATNWTSSLHGLAESYDAQTYGYRLTVMPEDAHDTVLKLTPEKASRCPFRLCRGA